MDRPPPANSSSRPANSSSLDTLTPQERAAYEKQEQDRAMAEARARSAAVAGEYLSTQGVPGYGAPPGAQIGPPPAPPPAPVPPKPNLSLVTGPPAFAPRGESPEPEPAPEAQAQAFKDGAQASEAVARDDGPPDQPTPQGGGGGGGGIIPGGFYPHSMETQAKLGKPVPEEAKLAFGAASGLQMHAAEGTAAADKTFFDQQKGVFEKRVASAEAARADMARLQIEKDAEVNRRLAEIETLNKQAQTKPEDMFNDRVVLGRVLGFLFAGLGIASGSPQLAVLGGLAGGTLNSLVNEDIESRLKANKSNAQLASQQTDLLGMYLKKFGDDARAIQATKLAYWDSLDGQLDAFEAEHKGNLNPAALDDRRATILNQRAETVSRIAAREEADIMQSYAQRYHMSQYVGGSGGSGDGGGVDGYVLKTPDGTAYNFKDKETYGKAVQRQYLNNLLIDRNNEILKLRADTKKLGFTIPGTDAYEQRQKNMARLADIEEEKLTAIETSRLQGVIREGEYARKKELTGHALTGLEYSWTKPIAGPLRDAEYAAGDAVLKSQSKRFEKDINDYPKAATTPIVKHGYAQDPRSGDLVQVNKLTGQTASPDARLAPHGSRAMDPKKTVNVMERSAEETTPYAPRMPYRPPAPRKKK